jgi:heptosyltransferase I
MRICILRLSALGDIVMCLPLVRTLQKNFPDAEITWIIGETFFPLFEKVEGVNIIPIAKIRSFSDYVAAYKKLAPYRFDLLLATQASFSAHLLYTLIDAKRTIGYDSKRSKDFHGLFIDERIEFHKEHTVDGFLRFAKTIGAKQMCYDGSIPLEEESNPYDFPYFVVNPCSSKKEKDWNYENYIPVINQTKEKYGFTPILTGVKADKAICAYLEKECGALNLCGGTTLQELGTLLKHAKFLLSPDTGPAHIASALGTPVIGLFAPTSSKMTGPYFSKDFIIDKHEEVLEKYATPKELKLGWNVRIYHFDAMNLITIEDVQHAIRDLVAL